MCELDCMEMLREPWCAAVHAAGTGVRPGRRLPPLVAESVPAGFPSPAEDYMERPLDLNEHLVQRPEATYFVRVAGESMIKAGIHDGDILVVDRSLEPRSGSVVVASLDGEFTVKRLKLHDGVAWLVPENDDYKPIQIGPERDFCVWGVVRHVIHDLG